MLYLPKAEVGTSHSGCPCVGSRLFHSSSLMQGRRLTRWLGLWEHLPGFLPPADMPSLLGPGVQVCFLSTS